MKTYKVIITETLKMQISVQAEDYFQAEESVRQKYYDGDYVLTADHFTGVDFKTVPPQRQRDMER